MLLKWSVHLDWGVLVLVMYLEWYMIGQSVHLFCCLFINRNQCYCNWLTAVLLFVRSRVLWATVCKTVRPMLSVRCHVCLSVCLSVTLVYCGQTVGPINMKLGMQVGLGPGHIVLGGDQLPLPKGAQLRPPQFSAHFYCGQTSACIKMPLDMELGLGPGDFVRWGPRFPLPQRGWTP